jgi:aspartokinase/homoserine dehydrogenase 1
LSLIVLGVGGVGKALLRQIVAHRALHAQQHGVELEVLALADSTGLLAAPGRPAGADCLDDGAIARVLAAKEQRQKIAGLPGAQALAAPEAALRLLKERLSRETVVVDTTATESTLPALLLALDSGCRIVLANKKPLTVHQEGYNRLTRAGATGGPLALHRVRWETTCGAGLPVIVTLQRLLASGDGVRKIAGTFSGTLGYVMTGLEAGRRFSEVVREAHRLGYTEPDPRDDLGGIDVARKALILARGLGWTLDLGDVAVEGLYPLHMDRLTVAEFLAALPQLDGYFAEQVQAAQAQGSVLRYAAVVENGGCRVGPTMVGRESPLGRLAGTDNLIEFHTDFYTPSPLVIQGRGAGTEATAAGVLSDIIDMAYAR